MATFEQLPGELDLRFVSGDEIRIDCDFDVNLKDYALSNAIYLTTVYAAGIDVGVAVGETVTTFDVPEDDDALLDGIVRLSLPENKSSLLIPGASYRWYLRWVDVNGVTRTVLAGVVTPIAP